MRVCVGVGGAASYDEESGLRAVDRRGGRGDLLCAERDEFGGDLDRHSVADFRIGVRGCDGAKENRQIIFCVACGKEESGLAKDVRMSVGKSLLDGGVDGGFRQFHETWVEFAGRVMGLEGGGEFKELRNALGVGRTVTDENDSSRLGIHEERKNLGMRVLRMERISTREEENRKVKFMEEGEKKKEDLNGTKKQNVGNQGIKMISILDIVLGMICFACCGRGEAIV